MADALVLFIIVGLVFAAYGLVVMLVATIAQNKGRQPINWVLMCLVLSPLGALLLVLLVPPLDGPPGGGWGTPA